MKKLVSSIILSPGFQISTLGQLLRWFVRKTERFYHYSPMFKLDTQALDRPHYAYCLLNAAHLARQLGHTRIAAIEFGVAGGNGLAFMSDFSREVTKVTGIEIECYGFDTGEGMPEPEGQQDLPYWFAAKQYRMNVSALRKRLPNAHLVLGNIKDSINSFLKEYDPAPIGVIFNDTDYWSSTRDSFRLFDQALVSPEHFLPRIFMYFDDIIGSEMEMYGPYNGQLLAIEELNSSQTSVKIHPNQNLLKSVHLPYRLQIYYAHIFKHPDYTKFVGAERQKLMEKALQLHETF